MFLPTFPAISCGVSYKGIDAVTEVSRAPAEDLARVCDYELILAKPAPPSGEAWTQNGAFVIYQRGDSATIFGDPAIRKLMQSLRFSLILADECDAKSYGDFQSDPWKGPGRELFQALAQFAAETAHPELANVNVILYGFSAGGVLAAEMASYQPSRILGIISYAAGSAHQNIAAFSPHPAALQVPSLFLANSQDADSGTTRSLDYFLLGQSQGALWAYAVQNGVGHCCNATTEPIILAWLPPVIAQQGGGVGSSSPVASGNGVEGFFLCSPNGTMDAQNDENCDFTSARLSPPAGSADQSVWLPSQGAADAWLSWVDSSPSNDVHAQSQ